MMSSRCGNPCWNRSLAIRSAAIDRVRGSVWRLRQGTHYTELMDSGVDRSIAGRSRCDPRIGENKMLMTGKDYLDSIRDGRRVYVGSGWWMT